MTAAQAITKFYSSKSNAKRAAKAQFGDNFLELTKLVQSEEEGFAYVALPVKKELTDDELAALHLTHDDNCPHCGISLDNGIGEHLQEVNDGVVRHEKFQFACLGCGGEFGPRIKAAAEKRNFSEIESPCRAVWNIADNMPGAKRKDVLAACEAAGIAFYTARTQYQLWRTVQKEMEERAAQTAKKN